jgi:hypothetical protein
MSLDTEKLISLRKACRTIPGREKPLHVSVIYRWATTGLRGGIKLECKQIGGIRYTSAEALERFFQRLTAASGLEADAGKPAIRTPARRQREHNKADAELAAAGW